MDITPGALWQQQPGLPPPGGRRPRSTAMIVSGIIVGLVGSGAMVWQGTAAVFSGATQNAGNSWSTATVSLTDDDSNGVMFTGTNLIPGSTDTKCIKVNYGGSVASEVRLYSAGLDAAELAGLATKINLEISMGSGGTFADCTGFTASPTEVFTGTLAAFGAKTTFANGVVTGANAWKPDSSDDTMTYRIKYTVDSSLTDQTMAVASGVNFIWEAQSS